MEAQRLTFILAFLFLNNCMKAQTALTIFSEKGKAVFDVSVSTRDSLIKKELSLMTNQYLKILNDQQPLEIIPYNGTDTIKVFQKEYLNVYVNIAPSNATKLDSNLGFYLYNNQGKLKDEINLSSGSVTLGDGTWLVYTISRIDSNFNLSKKFTIKNKKLNGIYYEYNNDNHIEKCKFQNGLLVDSLIRSKNGEVYLLEIRSKTGQLISNTRYYNFNQNRIYIYEDYICNIGLVYNQQTQLEEFYFLDDKENEEGIIFKSYKVDNNGRVVH